MPQLKELKDRPQPTNQQPSFNTGVIIVPGVAGSRLDEQTCSHFQELMKKWCAAPHVWTYDHDVQPHTQECWHSFCAAGDDLLEQMLKLVEQNPNIELVLIGHRLGAFILKKALIHGDRRKRQNLPAKLFEALKTLVMIGDPFLNDDNRKEWPKLVQDCLPQIKKTAPETFSQDSLSCLKFIEETFEQVTIQSQFFQVHGNHPAPSKLLRPFESLLKQGNCVCDGNVTVRMWITKDADEAVPSGAGKTGGCIFKEKGAFHQPLQLITSGEYWPEGSKPLPPSQDSSCSGPIVEEGAKQDLGGQRAGHEETIHGSTTATSSQPPATASLPEARIHISKSEQCTDGRCESSSSGNGIGHDKSVSRQESTRQNAARTGASTLPHSVARLSSGSAVASHESRLAVTSTPISTEHRTQSDTSEQGRASPQSAIDDIYEVDRSSASVEQGKRVEVPARIRSRPLPLRLSLPSTCDPFVGREDTMQKLQRIFFPGSTEKVSQQVTTQGPTIAVVSGIPGIGKTQIARKFAHEASSRFDAVFWLRAENKSSITRSLHELAIALRLVDGRREQNHERSAALCLNWLETSETSWLLIFDNAESAEVINSFIPHNSYGSIIITTCRQSLELAHTCGPIYVDVGPFTETESLELLRKSTSLSSQALQSESVQSLMKCLSFRPLDLSQVAGYICVNNLKEIPDDFVDRLSLNPASDLTFSEMALSTVLSVAVRSLSNDARRILALLAYLDPDNTQTSFIEAVAERFVASSSNSFEQSEERFKQALEELKLRHLIATADKGKRLQIHRALQYHIRHSMSVHEEQETLRDMISLLIVQWPSAKKFRNCLHGFWPEFDDVMDTCLRFVVVIDGLDESTTDMVIGSRFTNMLCQSLWYDHRIRGNRHEDSDALDFVHSMLIVPNHSSLESTSRSQPASSMPRRLVFIDHRRQKWQLIETQGKQYPYLAISFGFAEQDGGPKLTRSTLNGFRAGESMRRMPKPLKFCSYVGELLAVDYIWSDALCILQDDDDERVSEICALDNTYRCALSTIAPLPRLKRGLRSREINWGPYSVKCGANSIFNRLSAYKNMCQDQLPDHRNPLDLRITVEEQTYGRVTLQDDGPKLSTPNDTASTASDRSFNEPEASINPSSSISSISASPSESTHHEPSEHIVTAQDDESRQKAVEGAEECIEEGHRHYNKQSHIRAIASFVQARDSVLPFTTTSQNAMQAHVRASTYLASLFLRETCAQAASVVLSASEKFLVGWDDNVDKSMSTVALFNLTRADVLMALGNIPDATTAYSTLANLAGDDDNPNVADLAAIAKLRLSDLRISDNDLKEAQRLVKETVAHFEEQESQRGQSQYARALYHQASIYAADGKGKLKKRSMAVARQALDDVCEEFGLLAPPAEKGLEMADFEGILELGFV
ncbi:hypothetical protein FB567DRAFT_538406 [Paraphoma chrysanthemicola]|uniref:NB-ARC domain-containing protein n=1 Tax=Paraphoma chrysanthemicola TaxID=798071 RepID=A0A8K0VTS5_9PLEO|nr:hypothetical protein FB567DRAFT_538406 [Paraphoma chrysanthemicola]